MSRGQGRTAYRTSKELADNPGGLFPFTLQREMAGVEQVDFGVRIIALKGIGACAYNKPAPPAFSVPAKRPKNIRVSRRSPGCLETIC
jgi:hypothetical protein